MPKYRVNIAYMTRRGGTDVGMYVEADDPDHAEKQACDRVLKGYRARKFVYCIVQDAQHSLSPGD